MKDRDKWRDRVEISLDNKQIFFLFCGVAVVVSLVFALGVVVGKRLRPAVADEPRMDPLALLDQFAGDPGPERPIMAGDQQGDGGESA